MTFFNAAPYPSAVFPIEPTAMHVRPRWQSTDIRTKSGARQTNAEWSDQLRLYNITPGIRTLSDFNAVLRHHNAMRGMVHAFPLTDRTLYKVSVAEAFGTGDGSTTAFQLKIDEGNAANSYIREIYKPKSGTLAIYKNALLQTVTTHYTVDYATGIVTFTSAPANGLSLTWTGEFYIPVHYLTDEIDASLFVWVDGGKQLVSGQDIILEETRDIS
jgi:uncharacterized protein (TIGR02217 family)